MARVSRRSKRRRAGYDEEHVRHLLRGVYIWPGAGFSLAGPGRGVDREAMRKGWDELRADLLPAWIDEHPGTRPYAWWEFDAPERRRRTDGAVHPFDDRGRNEEIERRTQEHPEFREQAYKLFRGMPNCLFTRDDFAAEWESEAAYLDRLGLLTPAEKERLHR